MRERRNETSLEIASAKRYCEPRCSEWKSDASVSCSHTWVKQLDVSAPQMRARGELRLLCTVLRQGQLLSCSGHWSLDVAARSVLIMLELCEYSSLSQGDTGLNEGGSIHRGFVVCSRAKRVCCFGKPAVQRGELGRSYKECVPKKNISGRQRLFHFLIENEFSIYSIQTNMNLEGAWRTDH